MPPSEPHVGPTPQQRARHTPGLPPRAATMGGSEREAGGEASQQGALASPASASKAATHGNSNVSSALELMARSENLEENLRTVERELYDLETAYLQDSSQTGSVLRGFEAFMSARVNVSNLKRPRKFQTDDRVFSLSSATSLASEEDGRVDGSGVGLPGGGVPISMGRVRQSTSMYSSATAAGTPSTGPGKQNSQKRGRGAVGAREGKKLRQQIEQEDSDDEDSQTSSLA